MEIYNCYYFQTQSGRCPVEEFVDSLSESALRQYFSKINLLEAFGRALPMPHAKKIENKEKIYELRFNDRAGIVRILYFFFDGNNIILTNAFAKKTQKTPRREIETAIKRKRLFLAYKIEKKPIKPADKLKKK